MNELQKKFIHALRGSLLGAFVLGLALVFAGCEDDNPVSPTNPTSPDSPSDDDDRDVMSFVADMTELNGSGASGTVTFEMSETDNTFRAVVDVDGLEDAVHAQHVHLGSSCPTDAADANGDGFVDVIEGAPSYGPILISLDNSLEDNRPLQGDFPSGTSIDYDESVDLDVLLNDLRRPDDDIRDVFVTLGRDEGLGLEGRHVVIHGVASSTDVPGSVATIPGLPSRATLPVACGAIDLR